jgi:transcriptional regulator with XRE-family HTH domain
VSSHAPKHLRVVPALPPVKEPLWRDVVGDVLRRERREQERTLKDVADTARISLPYLSEVERGRKEASSEVLAAAARALGLSLAELLDRVQAEVVRLTAVRTPRVARAADGRSAVTSVTELSSRRPQRGTGAPQAEVRLRLVA